MERNLHTDYFEELLREKSEEFRMYPSKRIWSSIYNNIHPGRKWPSVAMSITLITSLFLVGYLNTKNTSSFNATNESIAKNSTLQIHSGINSTNVIDKIVVNSSSPRKIQNDRIGTLQKIKDASAIVITKAGKVTDKYPLTSSVVSTRLNNHLSRDLVLASVTDNSHSNVSSGSSNASRMQISIKKEIYLPVSTPTNDDNYSAIKDLSVNTTNKEANTSILTDAVSIAEPLLSKVMQEDILNILLPDQYISNDNHIKSTFLIKSGISYVEQNNLTAYKQDIASTQERNWINNFALYNRPSTRKWANKLSWQVYATPSVIYRNLNDKVSFGSSLTAAAPPFAALTSNVNSDVIQKPSYGAEVGAGLQYSIFKGIKLKAGLQLNYTRYNSDAFQNTHPVLTRLSMHDYNTDMSYEDYRTTPFSNKSGPEPIKLHNETIQISLPIGLDFKIVGNENLQWNVGVTIQPTFIPAGKSYLISTDRRYYVKETSLLNRWNMNAAFETFISYKSNGITYQLGPQFRSQLLSTNNRKYVVEEKLHSYGLKFGIIKTLK
ncbi:MAG: hypothetical protein ABIN94_10410 [Ferruginibacter sp.]